MKKFSFSLSSVKEYKDSLLENLKLEHAAIMLKIREQEKAIARLIEKKDLLKVELNQKNAIGIAPFELVNYQRYIKVLQNDIEVEHNKLKKLHIKEAEKKEEVIEMKKETASYEKLEEKKLEEYNFLARKSHEQFIEEFVSNKRYAKR